MVAWLFVLSAASLTMRAQTVVHNEQMQSVKAVVNGLWLNMPVMRLASADRLNVAFDYLSHDYHRFRCHLRHCEADWQPSENIFESDYIDGFNDFFIEDYIGSINTNVDYNHYEVELPNERCRLTMSGNYIMEIIDDDTDQLMAEVAFYVTEQLMSVALQVYTNTDQTINHLHQQVDMTVNYGTQRVSHPDRQIHTVVMQNGLCAQPQRREGMKPNIINAQGMQWTHCRDLIFMAGDEYRKFEILDTDRPSTNVDHITWDGQLFNAWLFTDQVNSNYLTDEDANGAFLIRNSDNIEVENTCEYMMVHFTLDAPSNIVPPMIDGQWTNSGNHNQYAMEWDDNLHLWHKAILLKQGYYSYTYLMGEWPSFFQTENTYQAFVYYKELTDRTWRLVAFTSAAYPSRQTPSPY